MNTIVNTQDIHTLTVSKDDVIVVYVDTGNLPRNKAQEYLMANASLVKTVFPNNQVLALPKACQLQIVSTPKEN